VCLQQQVGPVSCGGCACNGDEIAMIDSDKIMAAMKRSDAIAPADYAFPFARSSAFH
jgi:hypothetical protein